MKNMMQNSKTSIDLVALSKKISSFAESYNKCLDKMSTKNKVGTNIG